MPALATSRQPGTPAWFSRTEGRILLAAEQRWVLQRLAARPVQPWLWIAPARPEAWTPPRARGLLLNAAAGPYEGAVRCRLPLPVASGCIGDVVLQHPPGPGLQPLLEECARLLLDGGRLWLCTFNPCSPYRLRAGLAGLGAPPVTAWIQRLHGLGLTLVGPPHCVGPRWRPRHSAGNPGGGTASLRAGCVLEFEKRVRAPVGPAPAAWRPGPAPAA